MILFFGSSPAQALGRRHHESFPDTPARSPRLSFLENADGSAQLRVLRDRLARGLSPWRDALAKLESDAAAAIPGEVGNPGRWDSKDSVNRRFGRETARNRLALARAAMAYLGTKGVFPSGHSLSAATIRRYRDEARSVLGTSISRLYDRHCLSAITAADSIAVASQAYDLLRALESAGPLEGAYSRLTSLVGDVDHCFEITKVGMIFGVKPFSLKHDETNHAIRAASAVGLASLAIEGDDGSRGAGRARAWATRATEKLALPSGVLAHQIAGGFYAEGTGYLQYAMNLALPYLFHAARHRADRSDGRIGYGSDRLNRMFAAVLQMETPSAQIPPIDNSNLQKFGLQPLLVPGTEVAAVETPERFQRMVWEEYRRAGRPIGNFALEVLYAMNPEEAFLETPDPNPEAAFPRAFPMGGEGAVLRQGTSNTAGYVFIHAERGADRVNGRAHDSVDNLDFLFASRGDFINLDPGYAGYSEASRTNAATERSMVLVDGGGPDTPSKPKIVGIATGDYRERGTNANIPVNLVDDQGTASVARGYTAYRGAKIRRAFALVGDGLLAIRSRATSADGKARRFDVRFQANVATPSAFAALSSAPNGICYETAMKAVPTCVATTGLDADAPFSAASQTDAFLGALRQHGQANWRMSGAEVDLLSVIVTNPAGAARPRIESRISIDGGRRGFFVENAEGRFMVVVGAPGHHVWPTDATLPSLAAVGTGLRVFRLSSNGRTWERVASPARP